MLNYIQISENFKQKYRVNLERFCFHLSKKQKLNFFKDYARCGKDDLEIIKEVINSSKILQCDMEKVLDELTPIIKKNSIEFIKTLAENYTLNKVMFF